MKANGNATEIAQAGRLRGRASRWAWATLLALAFSGAVSTSHAAEPKGVLNKMRGGTWKSATPGEVVVESTVPGTAATGTAGPFKQVPTEAAAEVITENASAQVTEETAPKAEPPVLPVEEKAASPASPLMTPDETIMEEVSDEVPVSIATGLCPPGRLWLRKEVLLWWIDGQDTPALVTGSPVGTPQGQSGVIGQPGTTVLFGDGPINDGFVVGGRFQGGYWLDKCNTIGIQGGFFFLGQRSSSYTAASPDGSSIIARPFFDADPATNAENSQLVSYPGLLAGSVNVNSDTNVLGADLGMRKRLCCKSTCAPGCAPTNCNVPGVYCCRWDLLSGFRYFRLADNLDINENLTTLGNGPAVPGTNIRVNDRFRTQNNFYGYDIGTMVSCYRGRWFWEGIGRVGIGGISRNVRINGSTVSTVPGAGQSIQPGGLLAQPTNIGDYNDADFAVMPEVGLNLGYQVTKHIRVLAGYTFLGVSSVARAGDQIDRTVNSTQLGGGNLNGSSHPAFNLNDSFFWAQGVNLGLDCRF